jgi:hypothetical protein
MSYEFDLLDNHDSYGLINVIDDFEECDFDEENIEREIINEK